MDKLTTFALASLFTFGVSYASESDYPESPHKLKEAEAQGLIRVGTEELKTLLNGMLDFKAEKGKFFFTFSPDGSVERKGQKSGEIVKGKWNIDEAKNAYCTAFTLKRGYEKICYAVFRAPDGVHFFDYEVDAKFHAHVWRQKTDQ